ncbi:MAG: hypothetical protein QMC67_06425 [Candidatus Wallbacteria bacterium]
MRLNFYKNSKKGMAILVALTVCTLLLIYCTTLFQKNKNVRNDEFRVKEALRAQFLAKGVTQIALLKIRELPTEFYDAVRWKKGWVNETDVTDNDIRKFIPNISTTLVKPNNGLDDYLNFYVGFKTTSVGANKISGTPLPDINTDLSYFCNVDASDKSSFKGEAMVKQINLLGQYNNNFIDSIELVSEGMEDSGNTYMMGDSAKKGDGGNYQYSSVYRKIVNVSYITKK